MSVSVGSIRVGVNVGVGVYAGSSIVVDNGMVGDRSMIVTTVGDWYCSSSGRSEATRYADEQNKITTAVNEIAISVALNKLW